MGENSSLYKQHQFAIEYLKDHNETQAAIRAGYARKGAAASGRRLLENPKVQLQIQQMAEEQARAEKQAELPKIEQQEILDFLTFVLRGGQGKPRFSLQAETPWEENPACFRERMHAAELLGQYFHLFGAEAASQEDAYLSACENAAAPFSQRMN